jgi:hypothetical protein
MYTWIKVASGSDLAALTTHVPSDYAPAEVVKKLTDGLSSAVKGILVEHNYIDKDYRSTYYNFYAKKGQRYRSDCVRLHFFDELVTFDDKVARLSSPDHRLEDHYFGYMVLRPTGIATIGRSVVSPDVRSGANKRTISTHHKVHLLGYKLTVQGFPSMDQHIDIAVCAHVACWAILRHYSERYNIYREFLTHDITLMAQAFDPGGLVPSKGLAVSHAERVFQEAGTFPIVVTRDPNTKASFYRELIAYVESGFPLFAAMHGRRHAIAIVGYEWRASGGWPAAAPGTRYAWDEVQALSVVDDNHLPYLSIQTTGGAKPYSAEDIDAFIVPLPEKVFYPAEAVERLAPTLFKYKPVIADLPPQDQTIIRYFITTGSAFRRFMREQESAFDPKLVQATMVLPFAQFVWVVEFATTAQWQLGQIAARAIVDATASVREVHSLWLFHDRKHAMVFGRQTIGDPKTGMGVLSLSGMDGTAFQRMDQNLRPTQTK